jgi:hexosaminidase
MLEITLDTELPQTEIYYTLDGTEPTTQSEKYKKPISLHVTTPVVAKAFINDRQVGEKLEEVFKIHKATGKNAKITYPFSRRYSAGGDNGLTNSIRGTKDHMDGKWQGFEGVDFEAVVDLGEIQTVQKIEVAFLQHIGAWIFLPEVVDFYVSENGEDFTMAAHMETYVSQMESRRFVEPFSVDFPGKSARYVKVHAKNIGTCPEWHSDAGGKAWLFVDEIVVE